MLNIKLADYFEIFIVSQQCPNMTPFEEFDTFNIHNLPFNIHNLIFNSIRVTFISLINSDVLLIS